MRLAEGDLKEGLQRAHSPSQSPRNDREISIFSLSTRFYRIDVPMITITVEPDEQRTFQHLKLNLDILFIGGSTLVPQPT